MKRQICTFVEPSPLPFSQLLGFHLLSEAVLNQSEVTEYGLDPIILTDSSSFGGKAAARLIISFSGKEIPPEVTDCNGFSHIRVSIDYLHEDQSEKDVEEIKAEVQQIVVDAIYALGL